MITTLTVSNYRSLGEGVRIEFGRLSVLVGPNGSGKSNVVAVSPRGGRDVKRRPGEGPDRLRLRALEGRWIDSSLPAPPRDMEHALRRA